MNHFIRNFFVGLLVVLQALLISANLSCSKTAAPAAQNALKHPESIVYDAPRDRYLISNVEGKNIVVMDASNKFSTFAGDLTGPKGMVLRGDELYVADVNSIRGFDVKTGEQTWFLPLPDAKFLNDISADNTHYLFCSDTDANCIYRIDTNARTFETFKSGELMRPNGIYFDAKNDRLLIVSQRHNSPIQALNWKTQKLETLMETKLSSLDGLARDNKGNYYITSWDSKGVFKISPGFKSEPVLMKKGYNGPADIGYNPVKNILVLPVMMENRVEILGIW